MQQLSLETGWDAPPGEPLVRRPDVFQHPQANRHTQLHGQAVAYVLKRAARRTLGLTIRAEGLVVHAPLRVSLTEIDALVQHKAGWILRKFEAVAQRQPRVERAVRTWADGESLPWLGGRITLHRGAVLGADTGRVGVRGRDAVWLDGEVLWVQLPPAASTPQVRDSVQAWMERQALAHFTQRLHHFAPQLGVQWRVLKLSNAGTRWGSAKADGSIRLHWRLMEFDTAQIDYVVVHELSHLRHMNHSAQFWATVGGILPGYADVQRQLRRQTLLPWA
jgi:predicted metal-dependent hydrolase